MAAITRVYNLSLAAEMLGVDEDTLFELAEPMSFEDGYLWVCGPGGETKIAFTDLGIENLRQDIIDAENRRRRSHDTDPA